MAEMSAADAVRIAMEQVAEALRLREWWEKTFTCRFGAGLGPIRPGTALYGVRLRIQMESEPGGEWVTVDEHCQPVAASIPGTQEVALLRAEVRRLDYEHFLLRRRLTGGNPDAMRRLAAEIRVEGVT